MKNPVKFARTKNEKLNFLEKTSLKKGFFTHFWFLLKIFIKPKLYSRAVWYGRISSMYTYSTEGFFRMLPLGCNKIFGGRGILSVPPDPSSGMAGKGISST